MPNSLYRYDACGVCGDPASDAFNADCLDCAGVLHGARWTTAACAATPPTRRSRARACRFAPRRCAGATAFRTAATSWTPAASARASGASPTIHQALVVLRPRGDGVRDARRSCCACVDRASHWHALPGGAAEGPPAALAEDLWRQGGTRSRSRAPPRRRSRRARRGARRRRHGTVRPGPPTRARSRCSSLASACAAFVAGWDTRGTPRGRTTCHSALTYVFGNAQPARRVRRVAATTRRARGARRRLRSGRGAVRRLRFVRRELRTSTSATCASGTTICVGCDGVPGPGKTLDGCPGSTDPRYLNFRGRRARAGPGCSDPGVPRRLRAGEGGCRGRTACLTGRDPGRVRRVGWGRPGHGQGGELHVFRGDGFRFRLGPRLVLRLRRRGGRRVGVLRGRRGVRVVRNTPFDRTRITTPITSTT